MKKLALYPGNKDWLFENYYALKRIFAKVLGLYETDYISIALINSRNNVLLISSNQPLEFMLIEQSLWKSDPILSPDFFEQDEACQWPQLYNEANGSNLLQLRMKKYGYEFGVSIPCQWNSQRVVFSFATKSKNVLVQNNLKENYQSLQRFGQFCLNEINDQISLPLHKGNNKPTLKLIINNEANL